MDSFTRSLTKGLAFAALAALGLAGPAAAQDDTALFSAAVPPNVMLFVDNSGSMNEIMWHPNFVKSAPGACPIFNYVAPNGASVPGGSNYNSMTFSCNASTADCFFSLSESTSGFVQTGTVSCPSGGTKKVGYITRTFCSNTRNLYIDAENACRGNTTRYGEEYVEWLFSDLADPYWIGNESNTSTDITKFDANNNGTHYVTNTPFALYKRTRITAAREVAKDVIYQVDSNCGLGGGFPCPLGSKNSVRFGTGRFDATSSADYPGGFVSAAIDNYSTNATALDSAINALDAETYTPLAESLFKIYTYFMSRTSTERPFGKDGVTRFPKYAYALADGASTSSPPGDPLVCPPTTTKCSCQKNFVVIITDGEPTKDNFLITGTGNSNTTGRTQGFGDFKAKLIGDYNADGEVEEPSGSDAWRYLDDIAKFMATNDFRPDIPGNQTIDVYTVGFSTDPAANALLSKTAAVGNGEFFTGTQAQELTDALVSTINSIILKSQSFTAATVPATRTSSGSKFYNSLFVPATDSGYWEGHLLAWTITDDGQILDANGNCAFTGNPTPCNEGTFAGTAVPFWDAAAQIPAPASRNLYTSRVVSGTPQKATFDDATIDETLLTLASGDASTYAYTPPSAAPGTLATLADMVVENVRGCKFGTGVGSVACQSRTNLTNTPQRLGDIFHSNPVVVGRPTGLLGEQSYIDWKSQTGNPTIGKRKQVIVAGANDGIFRMFDAGDWQDATPPAVSGYDSGTGGELAGFIPYTARKNVKFLAKDAGTRDYYFTDGSPTVADVWLYSTPTSSVKASSEWRTVAFSGMRQGGNQYFALDISNPASVNYPGYLWEFPRENAPASITQWFGQSWSEPVIARVKLAVNGDLTNPQERWVMVVAGGYAGTGDPNGTTYSIHSTAGRSITMVDIKTGQIVAQKTFTDTPAATDPALVTYNASDPTRSMLYAMPSTPAVFDLDFDGFADVIYVGDLGGNMWKWVVANVGNDPVNSGNTSVAQLGGEYPGLQGWYFGKFFATDPYPAPPAAGPRHYRSFFFDPSATLRNGVLWLAFASGERAQLNYAGNTTTTLENNRFYAVKDLDPYVASPPATVITDAALTDITGGTSFTGNTCVNVDASSGFYFRGVDGEKFVTATSLVFYYVFGASFRPTTSTDACASGGSATLYAFKVFCGEGLFEDASGNPVATIGLGDGMPTDPKVSLSGANGGSRVFVNKKDEVLSKDTGFTLKKTTGLEYWQQSDE